MIWNTTVCILKIIFELLKFVKCRKYTNQCVKEHYNEGYDIPVSNIEPLPPGLNLMLWFNSRELWVDIQTSNLVNQSSDSTLFSASNSSPNCKVPEKILKKIKKERERSM